MGTPFALSTPAMGQMFGMGFIRVLMVGLTLISTVSQLGCAEKRQGPTAPRPSGGGSRGADNPGGPENGGSSGGSSAILDAHGTGATGGGTGFDGKVFESFIEDPTTLPAFTQILGPMLENIKVTNPEDGNDGYKMILKMKTWYIAPVDLQKIQKSLLGISFINSDQQQIARQTSEEVWVDSRIWDNKEKPMTLQEQADLLAHELVMTLYMFRFSTFEELCKINERVTNKDENCSDTAEVTNKFMPAEPPRQLNDVDNARIRAVVGWLLQNAKRPIKDVDFVRVMYNNGFDKRFFNPDNYSRQQELPNLKISDKEVFRAIKAAELTNNAVENCFGVETHKSARCSLKITKLPADPNLEAASTYRAHFTLANENPVQMDFILNSTTELNQVKDTSGERFYVLYLMDWHRKYRIGDRFYVTTLFFKKDRLDTDHPMETPLIFDSATIRPSIIVSIDKKREPVCLTQNPRADKLANDGLYMLRAGVTKTNMIQSAYLMAIPTPCYEGNVVD